MEPPAKPLDYLPTASAKWTLWGSIVLATLPYALPQSLLKDMRLSEDTLLWISRSLMSSIVLLIGAYFTLTLVLIHYKKPKLDLASALERGRERVAKSQSKIEIPQKFEEIKEKLLIFIANHPNKTTDEIARTLVENPQLILHHLERLKNLNLVDCSYHWGGQSWRPTTTGREYMAKNEMFIKPKQP